MNNSADMGDRRPGKSCPYDNYKGSSLLLASGAACDKLVADCMARHKTQADFLKALIAYEDSDCSHQLQASLAKADHESKCVRCTMFVMLSFSPRG